MCSTNADRATVEIKGHLEFYAVVARKGAHTTRIPEYLRHKNGTIIPALEEALARIKLGLFGICKNCGDKIEEKRLLAIPGAIRCVHCQGMFEITKLPQMQ